MGTCGSKTADAARCVGSAPEPLSGPLTLPDFAVSGTLLDDADPDTTPKLVRSPKKSNITDNPTPPESPKMPALTDIYGAGQMESPKIPALTDIHGAGQMEEKEPAIPKVGRAKSSPVMLPSIAVRSRQVSAGLASPSPLVLSFGMNSQERALDEAQPHMLKEVRSPSTAKSADRRKARRTVTFGEAQCHSFRVEVESDSDEGQVGP